MVDTNQTSRPSPNSEVNEINLFSLASEQGGYFTAAQARACGFSWSLLSHHAATGRFIRIRQGLYRFRDYPSSYREHVRVAWLSIGKDLAVVSHESALDLLDLSDIIPNVVHLTVPRSYRKSSAIPGVKIHTTTRPLTQNDVVMREGIKVTSPTRTIIDATDTGVAPEQIELAVVQAIERGQLVADQLKYEAAKRSKCVVKLVANALIKRS